MEEHFYQEPESVFFQQGSLRLHAIQYPANKPTLLLLHGLTANAHAFHGLIQAGLARHYNLISLDQRGRGLSAKPAFGYTIRDHADDVIALMDHLNLHKVSIAGHSFGGLMASYLAWHHPERFERVIILDAAPEMNPNAADMLAPALGRIDKRYADFEAFLQQVKQSPYMNFWDEAMRRYYEADVGIWPDGTVEPHSNLANIIQVATFVAKEHWATYFEEMKQEVLMVVALDDYTLGQPLLPLHLAKKIQNRMQRCRLETVTGNHQTMLYGDGARKISELIKEFLQ